MSKPPILPYPPPAGAVQIVTVQHKMRDWLAAAGHLSLRPGVGADVLALPQHPPAWSAVQVDEQ
ncbi:hypothetical protein [Klebsiella variicola]|uniref:hypothetical protein n=1 Tax=Klebsiella variicola TaxID=244366 RepID=UPI001D182EAF|nr:hypothetical protein [Klebsiella variicola]